MAEVPVKDKIEYTVALVSDFAKKHSLSTTQAFNYLDRFTCTTTSKPKSKQENYNERKLQKTLENPNRPRHE